MQLSIERIVFHAIEQLASLRFSVVNHAAVRRGFGGAAERFAL